MADTETTVEQDAATAPATQPGTGADTNPPAQADPEPADTAGEVAKWKAMSRKNQKQSEANLHQLQQTQAELARVRADNARLVAKSKHPQITDDAFTLCAETDPDRIAAWADKYAELNPLHTDTGKEPAPHVESHPLADKTTRLAENPQGAYNPKPDLKAIYERSQNRQRSRGRNRNKTN